MSNETSDLGPVGGIPKNQRLARGRKNRFSVRAKARDMKIRHLWESESRHSVLYVPDSGNSIIAGSHHALAIRAELNHQNPLVCAVHQALNELPRAAIQDANLPFRICVGDELGVRAEIRR